MLPNAISSLMSPRRVTRRTRLWWPSVTRKPPRNSCSAYWTPLGTKKSVAGGLCDRPRADVGDRGRAAVLLDPVDAVDDVGLAERGPDERDEHVRGVTGEGDVHRSADAHVGNRRGQAAREGRDRARPRDPPAGRGLPGRPSRTAPCRGRPCCPSRSRSCSRARRRWPARARPVASEACGARCGGYARRHHGGDGDQRRQRSSGVHMVLLSLATHGARAAALGGVLPPLGRESSVRSSARAGLKSSPRGFELCAR